MQLDKRVILPIAIAMMLTALTKPATAGWPPPDFLPRNQVTSPNIPEVTFSNLPPCNGTDQKFMAVVTDAPGTIAWGGTVSSGGGSGRALIVCDGTKWVIH